MSNETKTYQSDNLDQPGEQHINERPGDSVGIVQPQSVTLFDGHEKLQLECNQTLGPITVAYETYGQLNPRRDNAILLIHALSGDAHVTGRHSPKDTKAGWWDTMVGPGKPFDTNKYFIICSNCLGGCRGTTGPMSINPRTNRPFGLNFPIITIGDMVEVQRALVDYLKIDKLLAVAGGSMGGMGVLDWAIRYPDRLCAALPIATTSRLSAQGIAFNAVCRNAILRDENFQNGTYYDFKKGPAAGLAVARMIGHITYLSEEAMHEKFGRRLQNDQDYKYAFDQEFSVESYLDYQGNVFVDRFDANTYLYVTKAIDYFDPSRQHGSLREAMKKTSCRFLVISFDSDWLFHPNQSQEIVNALVANKKEVTYTNINCSFGHDSFLLETNDQGRMISGFLHETHKRLQSENINPIKIVNTPAAQKNHAGSIFKGARVDHYQIARLIQPNSSVLDLGCGDGSLLELLREKKNVSGLGFTLGQEDLIESAKRGVNVIQYDMHDHLDIFDDQSYDYVVLSHALQVVHKPENILRQLLRIGREVIVSFPNFAYWPARLQLLVKGKAPVFDTLPAPWYDKPNETINYMSLSDFEFFVHDQLKAKLVKRIAIASRTGREVKLFPNLIANEAIFVIRGE